MNTYLWEYLFLTVARAAFGFLWSIAFSWWTRPSISSNLYPGK